MANALPRAHVRGPLPYPSRNLSEQDLPSKDEAIEPSTPISRRDHRKLKKSNCATELPTPPSSAPASPPQTPPNNPPRKKQRALHPSIDAAISPMPAASHALKQASPLLVCSLGNPGSAYAHTLHSAGHTVISHIASVKSYRPFQKGLSGLVSRPDNRSYSFGPLQGFREERGGPPEEDDWTFWQSTSLMNVSGANVKKAWREFAKSASKDAGEPRLVIVHDELEAALGKVSVKEGSASPKGHNGLKSCQASLGNMRWWRIGVGIGRPDSREPNVVAKYVLGKMNRREIDAMHNACPAVVAALRQISEGTR